jgi:signal transduction histidine kinase
VTDIQMPRLDGLAMVRELRALDPLVPIIVTTAFEHSEYLIRSIELAIDRYVLKPLQAGPLETALLACAHKLLAEHQLRHKEKLEAERAQARHEIGRAALLRGLAHDYNNLLQAILTSVDMALMTVDPESAAREFMQVAKRSSEEARQLSRRLVSLGHTKDEPMRAGPLETLIREAVEETLAGTPVRPIFTFQAPGARVRHQPEDLAQAFRNLAENAAEAMPGGGTLRVETRLCAEDFGAPYLRILLEDTGPGIPPEEALLIFEPYYSTKARGTQRGTGLGLAFCEAAFKTHGGSIAAEGEDGKGAVFVIRLPVVPAVV